MEKFFRTLLDLFLLILGIKILQELRRNKRQRPCPDQRITVDSGPIKYIPTQLVVWKKPGVSDADFEQWKAGKLKQYSDLQVKKMCDCDDSLELWEGDNVTTFIAEGVADAGGKNPTAPPSGGGDAIACYTYNLIIDLPEPLGCLPEQKGEERPAPPDIGGTPLTVAVFDTGLLPELKALHTTTFTSCLNRPGSDKGWNFAGNNDKTDDDYPSRHGSAVAKFITDREGIEGKQRINILPVKVHNKDGVSDLYSILCGFAYAANCGAKIVNASFGFYAYEGAKPPEILSQFVQKHLTDRNILLVAAAGNVNPDRTVGGVLASDIRNLNYHPFFPACLSKTHRNVLAVTTVCEKKQQVSRSQNFSNTIVDVGVDCDDEQNDFRFQSPLLPYDLILGSSYATPIVTGKIAQHYTDLINDLPNGKIEKMLLLQAMENRGILHRVPPLSAYIRKGYCTKK